MLSRLGAILARSVRPLTVVAPQSTSHADDLPRRPPPDQGQSQNRKDSEKQEPSLTLIPGGRQEGAPPPSTEGSPSPAPQPSKPQLGGIQQIFELFKLGNRPLTRWIGASAYQRALRKQKKTSRFRKGTLVDRKAE